MRSGWSAVPSGFCWSDRRRRRNHRQKSPAMDAGLEPLADINRARITADRTARAAYERAVKSYNERSGDPEPLEPPPCQRLLIQDATVEKAAELLNASGRGITVRRDEVAGWIAGMEKYSGKGGDHDRGFWLDSFDGKPLL